MSVEPTPRLAITRWSADGDPFTRSQLDQSHENLEARAAGFFSGTNRSAWDPAVFVRSFFYDTDDGILYYSDGTDWQNLTEFGLTAAISANTPGNPTFGGSNDNAARSDHVHSMPFWGLVGELQPVGTAAAVGATDKFARINHVHVLGANSVVSGTIATNAISNSLAFTPGVVNDTAIGSGAVTKVKIHADQQIPSGAIWAFGGTTTPPSGWLFCNGASYSTSVHPDLFAVIGYSYGGSSGTFMVPDLCDRMPRGAGNVTMSLGTTAGADTVTIETTHMPSHSHGAGGITIEAHAVHSHPISGNTGNGLGNHAHSMSHGHSASLASGLVTGGGGFLGSEFYYPPGGANDIYQDGTYSMYLGGGGPQAEIGNASLLNTSVNVSGLFANTGDANLSHNHSLPANTQNNASPQGHVIGGSTASEGGGSLLSILPKTQTVNYIIKL